MPTSEEIVFERFFDESGGMQLVIHAPLGARINRAWGLALRKRFCRSFDFELQASADDDGIVLSLGPQHSLPIEALFKMLNAENVRHLLEQALLAVPMFQVRWRWNVTRSLAVLRQQGGKRVPPHMQRFRSDDLLAAVFPETVGCLENHPATSRFPTIRWCGRRCTTACTRRWTSTAWSALFERVRDGQVRFVGRDTREPSPFSYELLNANPYAFLDGARWKSAACGPWPRAARCRATSMRDLARLDPEAIAQVRAEAWPLVRDADELHDALMSLVTIDALEAAPWAAWLDDSAARRPGHARRSSRPGRPVDRRRKLAHARAPRFPQPQPDPPVAPARAAAKTLERHAADHRAGRGRIEHAGPTTAAEIAEFLGLAEGLVFAPRSKRSKGAASCCAATSRGRPARRSNGHRRPPSGATGGCWPGSIA